MTPDVNYGLDTILNLWVFVFIGVLIWMYRKKDHGDED